MCGIFWKNLSLMDTSPTMANKGILYIVLKEYTTDRGNLHPNEISNLEMGYIFEEIIRRFSESHNEDAGQHYTPREVIQLMVNILFYDDNDILSGNNVAKTIYDPACGTGGMLSVAEEYLHSLNASTELVSFGQEINDQTFAICKADMLIKGNNADTLRMATHYRMTSLQAVHLTISFQILRLDVSGRMKRQK